jgi:hypothetical protein
MSAHLVIAAAGLAEGVWMMEMLVVGGMLLVIGLLGLGALCWRSKKSLAASMKLLFCFMFIFTPWHFFTPFDAEAYDDLDVVQAADGFRVRGMLWIEQLVLVVTSTVVLWRDPRLAFSDETDRLAS